MSFGAVIVDVSRSHHGDSEPIGEPAEAPVPVAVPFLLVVLELDEEPPGTEGSVQAPGEELGSGYAVFQRPRQRASTASSEYDETLRACEERREGKRGLASFTLVMRLTQKPAEVGVTSWGFGQEGHVAAPGQRVAVGVSAQIAHAQSVQTLGNPRNIQSHRDLCTGDGLEPFGAGRLGEFHGPVQAVVIRERHGRIAQLEGPKDQLFRMRGSVQEGETGMAVEFDVGRCGEGRCGHDIRFLFGLERIIDRRSVGCNENGAKAGFLHTEIGIYTFAVQWTIFLFTGHAGFTGTHRPTGTPGLPGHLTYRDTPTEVLTWISVWETEQPAA